MSRLTTTLNQISIIIMKKFVNHYNGAEIYEVSETDEAGVQQLNHRIVAKAILPGNGNLSVNFIQQSNNREQAIQHVQHEIDHYWEEHNLDELTSNK